MTDDDRTYARDAFAHWARSGYAPDLLEEVEERLGDLFQDPAPAAFTQEMREYARSLLAEQRAAEATWTEATDNDRLSEAFADLEDHGIVGLEDAGYTLSDGWSDCREAAEELEEARGAVFFHGQDVERGVRGEGLSLAFGALDDGDAREIGAEVVAVLSSHGFAPVWDGSADTRITLPPFPWKKRQFTESPL